MTDHPPDLPHVSDATIEQLAAIYGGWCGNCGPNDLSCPECAVVASDEVKGVLDALASWCDGDLFDPATGERVTVTQYATWHIAERDGQPWCSHPSSDGCNTPLEGHHLPLVTLTRKDQT